MKTIELGTFTMDVVLVVFFMFAQICFCRCEAVLGEFLRGIKRESKNVNFAHMVNILVIHSQSEGK